MYGMAWDLDHVDDDGDDTNTSPAHSGCNRRAGGALGGHRRAQLARARREAAPEFLGAEDQDPQPVLAASPPDDPVPAPIRGDAVRPPAFTADEARAARSAAWEADGQPPCDLDSAEYNLTSAWWGPPNEHFPSGWRALRHGCGPIADMRACACPVCWERAERIDHRPGPPPPPESEPKRVETGPVRDHVLELLAAGMSRDEIAIAAGIDRSTVCRLLKPYAAKVSCETAAALLAVTA